jgi:hypothetical protein
VTNPRHAHSAIVSLSGLWPLSNCDFSSLAIARLAASMSVSGWLFGGTHETREPRQQIKSMEEIRTNRMTGITLMKT